MDYNGYIIWSDKWGVYLGEICGGFFWSKLEPLASSEAVMFESCDDAIDALENQGEIPKDFSFVEVVSSCKDKISSEEVEGQGVEPWLN